MLVWEILGALSVAAVIWLALRYLRPRWIRRSHEASLEVDEERDSVFSWSHLIQQLHLALRRLLGRLRALWRRGEGAHDIMPGSGPGGNRFDPFEDIRAAYRGVLLMARRAKSPRAPAETAREFERRLSGAFTTSPDDGSAASLHVLTSLYQRVRYGHDHLSEHELASGQAAADAVIAQLEHLASTGPNRES
jgi:hypothetical protein